MYCITDEQITYILNDIRRNGVEMEDLQYNLLDHICCIVEQQLEDDGNFERFYHETVRQFYKTNLREIEEETIQLLTYKNYYTMKKSMIVSGAFSAGAFLTGSFFKVMHWPGAGILLTLGITIFSFVFLPLLLLLKTREAGSTRDKLIIWIGTLSGIMYCMSMLFMVQHWPGARVMWIITLFLTAFVLIPLYFFSGIRKPEARVNTVITTILLVAILGIHFTLTALRPTSQAAGKAYTYLQSEVLLQKITGNNTGEDLLAKKVQLTCEATKRYILETQTGITAIPQDFEDKQVEIPEIGPAYFMKSEEIKELLGKLRSEVNEYNAAHTKSQIPVSNSILDPLFAEKDFCSNLFVLNNITQIQLFLASTNNSLASIK